MNTIYLIGNGFDLSHSSPTKYSDFISDLIYRNLLASLENKQLDEDHLYFEATNQRTILDQSLFDPLLPLERIRILLHEKEGISDQISPSNQRKLLLNLNIRNRFLFHIIKNNSLFSWTDIENLYFEFLSEIAGNKSTTKISKQTEMAKLNSELNYICNKLRSYLLSLPNYQTNELTSKLLQLFIQSRPNGIHYFINFNYTLQFEHLYYNHLNLDGQLLKNKYLNYIHNTINDPEIIFGFEDGLAPSYTDIENLNLNEFLKYFKSFKYLEDNKFKNITKFVKSNQYIVVILGHSCGISDRTLLNFIFENENCEEIFVTYHQKTNNTDNFSEITQNISRNFKDKSIFLNRVANKNRALTLPQS